MSCRHHLALDVSPTGEVREVFPGRELEDLPETCALDVADRKGQTLEQIGAALNVTRERVRQIERDGIRETTRRGLRLRVFETADLRGGKRP